MPALRRFAQHLREDIAAEQVLLFGSRGRGTAHAGSDYDLIVVSSYFFGMPARQRPVQLYSRWYEGGGDAPVDLVCLTPEEFDDARTRISLIADVLPTAVNVLSPDMDLRLQRLSPSVVFHERAPDASPERLREVLGIIKLNGRVPSWRDLDEDDPSESDNAGGETPL